MFDDRFLKTKMKSHVVLHKFILDIQMQNLLEIHIPVRVEYRTACRCCPTFAAVAASASKWSPGPRPLGSAPPLPVLSVGEALVVAVVLVSGPAAFAADVGDCAGVRCGSFSGPRPPRDYGPVSSLALAALESWTFCQKVGHSL